MRPLPGELPPRARRADHDSSHAAADAGEVSGRLRQDLARVLAAVRKWPGRTSKQLATLAGLERHAVARRLAELADRSRRGRVVRLKVPGEQITWWPLELEAFAQQAQPPSMPPRRRRRPRRCDAPGCPNLAIPGGQGYCGPCQPPRKE